ncbi:hypothetical protein E4U09_000136 [Claviceps aff. purpurea]|uniref:Uncharacterized protein n=1 Tax=Claviceps aff. purpurea TaxID=1967640 RepID=A0A9P7QB14_9HYPO|nr:hypothetical protein E4U09_000136 [Claviceps aff. purpurea]
MAIDFSDPEAMRLYFAQIEDRQASLLLQMKKKDEEIKERDEEIKERDEEIKERDEEIERDRKRRRLHEEEVASLREETEEAVQKMNAFAQENQGLKLETEGSPLLKYINISGKTICTKLVVEENPKRRTTGAAVTNIDGKVYPHDVKPWKGFLKELRVNFETVCQAFPPDYRGFYCSKTLDDISKQSVTPIANEPEVSDFISINIETPVKTILEKLKSLDPDGKVCRINGTIDFRRTAYDVNELNAEGLAGCRNNMANLQPDRFCVCFKRDLSTGSTTLLYF